MITALSLGLRPRESGQLSRIIPQNHGIIITLIIRLFRIQYKTPIAEVCDYFQNSTLDEIACWKKLHGFTAHSTNFY